MATVLHLIKESAGALALETIRHQTTAGDRVTVVALEGASVPSITGVSVRRVPDDLSYAQLLDLVFAADQVVSW